MLQEVVYTCPYCFEDVETSVDPSEEEQIYVEDCSVCCRPSEFRVQCNSSWEVVYFEVNPAQ